MNTPRPMGLYLDMSFETYHQVDALSASGMRHLARSAWHYKNRVPVKPTRPMLRGTLAHCAILEPDAMAARYAIVPDDAPRRPTEAQWNAAKSNDSSMAAKAWWKEFLARTDALQIVSADDYAITRAQLAAVKANPTLAEILENGAGEVSLFWEDAETGVYCKARLDWLNGVRAPHILELKSTADESPAGFGRTVARMAYHLQRAHYVAGYAAVTGKQARFTFAAVTSAAPVLAVPMVLDAEMVEQADDERRELLELYQKCTLENRWPDYGAGYQVIDIPAYARRSAEVEVAFADD